MVQDGDGREVSGFALQTCRFGLCRSGVREVSGAKIHHDFLLDKARYIRYSGGIIK